MRGAFEATQACWRAFSVSGASHDTAELDTLDRGPGSGSRPDRWRRLSRLLLCLEHDYRKPDTVLRLKPVASNEP